MVRAGMQERLVLPTQPLYPQRLSATGDFALAQRVGVQTKIEAGIDRSSTQKTNARRRCTRYGGRQLADDGGGGAAAAGSGAGVAAAGGAQPAAGQRRRRGGCRGPRGGGDVHVIPRRVLLRSSQGEAPTRLLPVCHEPHNPTIPPAHASLAPDVLPRSFVHRIASSLLECYWVLQEVFKWCPQSRILSVTPKRSAIDTRSIRATPARVRPLVHPTGREKSAFVFECV